MNNNFYTKNFREPMINGRMFFLIIIIIIVPGEGMKRDEKEE